MALQMCWIAIRTMYSVCVFIFKYVTEEKRGVKQPHLWLSKINYTPVIQCYVIALLCELCSSWVKTVKLEVNRVSGFVLGDVETALWPPRGQIFLYIKTGLQLVGGYTLYSHTRTLHPLANTTFYPAALLWILLSVHCIISSRGGFLFSLLIRNPAARVKTLRPTLTCFQGYTYNCASLKTICELNNTEGMCPVMLYNPLNPRLSFLCPMAMVMK